MHFLLLVLLIFVFASEARANTIPETIVFQAERIDNTKVGAGIDQGLVVTQVETPPLPKLIAKTRYPDGSLGSAEALTYTSNAEIPKDVVFSDSGDIFLTWGIATVGAKGEFASRPPTIGPFAGTATYSAPACGRFLSVSKKTAGGLLIACSANQGAAPADDVVLVSSLPSFSSTAFASPVTAQAPINDDFISPTTDTAPDGSMAVAWSTKTESSPGVFTSRIRALTSGDGDWIGSPTTTVAFAISASDYVYNPKIASLGGGRVAVLWFAGKFSDPSYGRLNLAVLNSSGAIEDTETVATKPTYTYSIIRQGEGALISWSETNGGMEDPITTKVASYASATLSSPTTLEANSENGSGELQINEKGDVLLSRGNGGSISAWIKKAGETSFETPKIIKDYGSSLSPDQYLTGASMSLDKYGDVFSSWVLVDSGPDTAYSGGLDFTKPTIESFSAPRSIFVDTSARFSATAIDSSSIAFRRWSFGDGKSENVGDVSYAYKKPGRYLAKFTVRDSAGLESEKSQIVVVSSKFNLQKTSIKFNKKTALIVSRVSSSGAGRVSQRAILSKKQVCQTSKKIKAKRTYTLNCNLGRKIKAALQEKSIKIKVETKFSDASGRVQKKIRFIGN